MTDTKARPTDASGSPVLPQSGSEVATDQVVADQAVPDKVVALMTASDFVAIFELYRKHLAAHILALLRDPNRKLGDKAELNLQYDRLAELEALIVLCMVWRESRYITEEDLCCAGLPCKLEKELTRNLLGAALHGSDRRPVPYGTVEKFTRQAARLVEAAMAFGLIEEEVVRSNLKLLHATAILDELLVRVFEEAAVLIHARCVGNSCEPSANGNGAMGV